MARTIGGAAGFPANESLGGGANPGRAGRWGFVLVALLAAGCAPGGVGAGTGQSAPETYSGTIQVVGSTPVNVRVVLEREGEAPVGLDGGILPELETLRGARVTVRGRAAESSDPMTTRRIEVTDYDILSINGAPVLVGEVIAVENSMARLRTADGVEVLVTGAPRSFRVGQKVWVQGPVEVTVQSYGTLRP